MGVVSHQNVVQGGRASQWGSGGACSGTGLRRAEGEGGREHRTDPVNSSHTAPHAHAAAAKKVANTRSKDCRQLAESHFHVQSNFGVRANRTTIQVVKIPSTADPTSLQHSRQLLSTDVVF